MSFAKTTSFAALAALLALGGPALAQSGGTATQSPPAAGATNLNPDGRATGGSNPVDSTTGSTEGRNTTVKPGDQNAAGSGNSDDGRRDCTNQQTPC